MEARWYQEVCQCNLDIQHIAGKSNVVADALSRRPDHFNALLAATHVTKTQVTPSTNHQSLFVQIKSQAVTDPVYTKILNRVQEGRTTRHEHFTIKQDVLYNDDKLYIPAGALRRSLLFECHDTALAGHLGRDKTYARLQEHFWWPRMYYEVKQYVNTCPSCQRNKPSSQPPLGHLQPLPIPDYPWQWITMDFITQLPVTSTGHDALFVVVDRLTKVITCIPTTTNVTAQQVADLFIQHVFRLHGLPSIIVSDRDPKFTSDFWQHLFLRLGTRLAMSTTNHPQTDGQTERANRTIEDMIRAFLSPFHNDWITYLPLLEFAYNSSKQTSTGFSPFFLHYGYQPQCPVKLLTVQTTQKYPADADPKQYAERVLSNINIAKKHLRIAQDRQASVYNRKHIHSTLNVGDQVLLSVSHFSNLPATSLSAVCKFNPRYYGPFKIIQIISPVAVKLQLPHQLSRLHPVIHISRLKPWKDGSHLFPSRRDTPQSLPEEVDGELHYLITEFRDVRSSRKGTEYLVQFADEQLPRWLPEWLLREDLSPDAFDAFVSDFKQHQQLSR
jgi:transposase InsO family protein